MKVIDVLGKPCPVPVIEAKKALAEPETDSVLVKVDNIVAVQNLEKMANGYGYDFAFAEKVRDSYEVTISTDGKNPQAPITRTGEQELVIADEKSRKLVVAIGRNTMGEGAEELGGILIKGFIYSLTELPTPPECIIFFNSGAYLTTHGSNTIDDLAKMAAKGTKILTCGTCVNYYELQGKLAVGEIADMYKITETIAFATNVVNI
ncbi:MAG: sulfurtransferase-like selenium metabolism protein YedF [Oscillospiraceae bacterium]|jgi:selenium metabolism protein YedF|nr:sulfurtransferase-like selenium metabolism protein YedF [Oscillospiraceae bacterium]